MSYHIQYTISALLDIENILEYIDSQSTNVNIYRSFFNGLKSKIKTLAVFPYSNKQAYQITKDTNIRITNYKRYYIVYEIDPLQNIVKILCISHMKRSFDAIKIDA